jgi:hypothetical protein
MSWHRCRARRRALARRLTGELIASWAWSAGPGPAAARWAVASAALSPVATIGGWLVAESLQPPTYSPLGSTITGLAGLGATDRWIMTIALLVVGACYFATAACLPAVRVPARIVLMVAGLSSIQCRLACGCARVAPLSGQPSITGLHPA